MLQFIEQQARISHRSEDRQTLDSWERFIDAVVIKHGDWSVTEHASITATIRTDRGVTHELVRHRLFSFTQESTRFVKYSSADNSNHQFEFVMPEWMKTDFQSVANFELHCENSEKLYNELIDRGSRPQEARSILPINLAATIAVTGNLRNWRLFFLMRTSKETLPEFRKITIPMLAEFKKIVPILFDDIEPEQRQIENLRKAR
jgi:thymidylate synthase (FAD)